MQPKISVIVPIYKVEMYLRQCIDSIIGQTYKNLEIILVDDGSPDNCGKICDEYAAQDERVIVVHKSNGGLSDARNAGLDIATGQYIGMVDSDDWLDVDMYESMYKNIVTYDADIACCGYYRSYKNKNIPVGIDGTKKIFLWDSEEAIRQTFSSINGRGGVHLFCAWNKLYKKHIFDNLRYPLGRIAQDQYIIVDVYAKANKIIADISPKYYYRFRKSGAKNTDIKKKFNDLIGASEAVLHSLKINYPHMEDLGIKIVVRANLVMLYVVIFFKGFRKMDEYRSSLSVVKKNYKLIITDDFFTKNEKIRARAARISIMLLKIVQSMHNHLQEQNDEIMYD